MNTSGITVTCDKVLLRLMKSREMSAGGIALAQQTVQKEVQAMYIGTLVACGVEAREMPEMTGIAEGELVIFAKYAGLVIQGKDGMYRIVRSGDVIGKTAELFDERMQGSRPMPDNS